MKYDIVDYYLNNILKIQLKRFKISSKAIQEVLKSIKIRLISYIANYNDVEFRNGLLVLGSEEGTFYVPKNENVANMVVITIRNSLLEGIGSKYYKEYGSSSMLDDKSMKIITSEAIKYFASKNLEEEAKKIEINNDFYKDIASQYPVAMKALIELAKCTSTSKEHDYESIFVEKPYELIELTSPKNRSFQDNMVESGISPMFNQSLCHLLKGIKNGQSTFFFTDCFKSVTRNFEKMLRVLEFILTHDAFFITSNYFITKDYVSRRTSLMKAMHSHQDLLNKIPHISDVSSKYRFVLEMIQNSYQKN